MTVYVVTPNEDNASVVSVHRTIEGAKIAADTGAGKLASDRSREWILDGATWWLYERIGDRSPWPVFYVEPFDVVELTPEDVARCREEFIARIRNGGDVPSARDPFGTEAG